jgi:outer membrane protein
MLTHPNLVGGAARGLRLGPAAAIAVAAWLAAAVGLTAPLAAQDKPAAPPELSLAAALREADLHAFANRMAAATTDADQARARLPLKGILPSARVESGVIRTTDPIGAFGTTMRQRLVTPAAFDPARLNDPAAITNVQSGLVLEVPVVNADAWTGLRAARAAADASTAARDWTAVTTRATVVRAYYGAVLAGEKVDMLVQAQRAVSAATRQVQAMVQQGLVTKADALQSSVRADDIESQLVSARNDALSARQQLALVLGRADRALSTLPTALPDDDALRALAAHDTLGEVPRTDLTVRADVRAARAGVEAANADRRRATATLLPRVNSFARYDWNAPSALFGGRKNWTLGVVASWSLFGGGSELADIAGATARAQVARAGADAASAQGALEADVARRGVAVALQRLDLANHAAEQSREAHRLVEKRYAGGLATIAELLGAESASTAAALNRSAARFNVIDAVVTYRRAIGADPGALSQLETTH